HDRRDRRPLRSRQRVGGLQERRGLRSDARLLGHSGGTLSGAAAPRAVEPARCGGPGRRHHPLRLHSALQLDSVARADQRNRRALVLVTIREERKAAFDWYSAVRSAYTQNRENRVHDRAAAPAKQGATPDEDLYDVDE